MINQETLIRDIADSLRDMGVLSWEQAKAHAKAAVEVMSDAEHEVVAVTQGRGSEPPKESEPEWSGPALRIEGTLDYGPILSWHIHWKNFPAGTQFYAAVPPALTGSRPISSEQIRLGVEYLDPGREDLDIFSFTEGVRFAEKVNGINADGPYPELEPKPLTESQIERLMELYYPSTSQSWSEKIQFVNGLRAGEFARGIGRGVPHPTLPKTIFLGETNEQS